MPTHSRDDGPTPLSELIAAELARLNVLREQAPSTAAVFNAMRAYRENREEAEAPLPLPELQKLLGGKVLLLLEGQGKLSIESVLASGFDGVVAHALFEDDRDPPQSLHTVAKLLVPFSDKQQQPEEDVYLSEEDRLYIAATEMIAHKRCHQLRLDFVPKLYAALMIDNPAREGERMPLLVMEYIPGTKLSDFSKDVAQGKAEFRDLLHALYLMTDQVEKLARSGVYVSDTNPHNAILQFGQSAAELRIVLFDFAKGFVSQAEEQYASYGVRNYPTLDEQKGKLYKDLIPDVLGGLGEAFADVCAPLRGLKHLPPGMVEFLETHVEQMREKTTSFERTKEVLNVMYSMFR